MTVPGAYDTAYATDWDPEYRALADSQRAQVPAVNRYQLPFAQARKLLEQERRRTRSETPALARISDERIVLAGREVPLRFFRPTDAIPDALVLYLHGGGWCVGSNETHDTILRHLAQASGITVCGMDYALAPEHPFPAATREVAAVADHLLGRLPPGQARLLLAGDSAGANLALVEAMRRRDAAAAHTTSPIAGLILLYGIFGPNTGSGSHQAYGSGEFGLSTAAQDRYISAYLDGATPDWRVFPLTTGSFERLPPIHLQAAELDLLRDDSIALHHALKRVDAQPALRVRTGVPHGYLSSANQFAGAREDLLAAGHFSAECLGEKRNAPS
jgi:acetyl esterase